MAKPTWIVTYGDGPTLSETEIRTAIEIGSRFNSRSHYLTTVLKKNRIKLAGRKGISIHATLFSDFELVAAEAASAKQEMRAFTSSDVARVPLSGLSFVLVTLTGKGALGTAKFARRYLDNRAQMVLRFGNYTVEPTRVSLLSSSKQHAFSSSGSFLVDLITGAEHQEAASAVAELEFGFRLTEEQRRSKASLVLTDGSGHEHKQEVDFASLMR